MPTASRSRRDPAAYGQALGAPAVVACPHCDLLQRLPDLASGASARCPRCAKELWRRRIDSLDRTLALAIAGALAYAIANSFPMLSLSAAGREASTTVLGGVQRLWADGRPIVSGLVLLTAVVAPALQVGSMLVIALGARRGRPPRWVGTLLRHLPSSQTWSMIEVMMIGVLVAVIKIAELATVTPGIGLFALGGLVFLLPAMQSSFDPREVWERVEWAKEDGGSPVAAERPATVVP